VKISLFFSIISILISFSARAEVTQCFDLFSFERYVFDGERAQGVQFKKPEYETFLRLFHRQIKLYQRLPAMHPELARLAMEVISDYEQALPFVSKIYTEIYDANNPQVSTQTVGSYYLALMKAKIVGPNLLTFETLISSDVAKGMEYLNETNPTIQTLSTSGVQ
jgi:hypothetical protein